ncbi:GGDEF domain-containing protein [Mesorhizobium sp. B2-4-6]|uniref:GGDEF domain-containing protein n=1 Tax=Mesorhizobium sp. B2-4-6 TaxID=2589943 RepID=UPI00112CB188|nr:GGDEF domain-containing protein [Mesorhizobium sp. B2-4-6]TPL45326.1 GGDEF domain-containing protein [Mesorhizobium sp. B2-4-6]
MDKSYLLSAILPLISVTLSVTFFFLWQRKKETTQVANWSIAYACATAGSTLDFSRVFVANPSPFSFLANVFLVGVAFFAVRGSLMLYTGKASDRLTVPIYLAVVAGDVWFVFVDPSIFGRGTTSSLGAALMFLIAARGTRKAVRPDQIDHMIAITFALSAVTLIARPVVSYIYEGPLQTEAQVTGSLWVVSFKVFAMLSWFLMAILFLLRIATDLMKELSTQSLTDPLTGAPNRRGFFIAAEETIRNASPSLPATLLILDIDHFKKVNDGYGHRVGDTVIRGLADILRHAAEETGCTIGRLGGEEFVALLPATNLGTGRTFAEGLRTVFAACEHEGMQSSHVVTTSIGVAESIGGESIDLLIERADGALYRAKRSGRNKVETADPGLTIFEGCASPGLASEIRRRGSSVA